VRLYIRPVLGDLAAEKLDAELLESFYARLQRCRDLCSGRPARGMSADHEEHQGNRSQASIHRPMPAIIACIVHS